MTLTLWTALFVLLAACGDDGGNEDTLLTGFSGVVILAIAVFFVMRAMKKRG
jgi:hypothetical protein